MPFIRSKLRNKQKNCNNPQNSRNFRTPPNCTFKQLQSLRYSLSEETQVTVPHVLQGMKASH